MTDEKRASRRERRKSRVRDRLLLAPETWLLLAGLASLLVLGLLGDVAAPALLLVAAFVAFMVPGALLAVAMPDWALRGTAAVPVAFALSTGVYGIPGSVALLLHWRVEVYLAVCGAILAVSLAACAVRLLYPKAKTYSGRNAEERGVAEDLLWVPFAGLGAVLMFASLRVADVPNGDRWVYLAWIREFMTAEAPGTSYPHFGTEIAAFTRIVVNGWLMEQSALSRLSGVDPVDLVFTYMSPALTVVSLLSFFALARVLFEDRSAALLAGIVTTLFFLFHLGSPTLPPGADMIEGITNDKLVARFVFLPVAAIFAVLFVREHRPRHLALFAFLCVSVMAVHPVGLALISIFVAGFGLAHVALDPRNLGAWTGVGGLALVLFLMLAPPAAYLILTGNDYLSEMDSVSASDSATLDQALSAGQLLPLGDGTYIAHPALLLDPVLLAAYLIGVPFLVWHLGRNRERHLAARALLGVLLFASVLVFFPPVAAPVGDMIGPWSFERLFWCISLAALLTVGWMLWELLRFVQARLDTSSTTGRMVPYLPLAAAILLIAASSPAISTGLRAADRWNETPQAESSCFDPSFHWMRRALTTPGLVLAPDAENSCVPAYSARADVIQLRGLRGQKDQPEGAAVNAKTRDMQRFFESTAPDDEMVEILERYEAGYILVPAVSPLNDQLARLPGITRLDNPGERYRFYSTDPAKLRVTPAVEANVLLNEEKWDEAVAGYTAALGGDEDERFLAHMGLGRAYSRLGEHEEAAASYGEAADLAPRNPAPLSLLAKEQSAAGNEASARTSLEKAVSLAPRDAKLRNELGVLLRRMGNEKEAVEQYRAVVEAMPGVPEYRVELGEALNAARSFREADAEFERAVRLAPRSADVYVLAGEANRKAKRPREAAEYLEKALDIDPQPQVALHLGLVYSSLSLGREKDEAYFERAERQFQTVTASEVGPSSKNQRKRAHFALGSLYERWEQNEKAADSYRNALKIDPRFGPARAKLERLPDA